MGHNEIITLVIIIVLFVILFSSFVFFIYRDWLATKKHQATSDESDKKKP
ncbi:MULTISPECIES: hypothetical protein [Spiroplasma]|uniref:Uncharacterized protein n=1 Tax=Spiroplasma eriocheiris TaxID=315358 RepID=A0A0H3XKQ6_9MOLU|nr:hypothetical protein [Spiroplasma eriocheiris]AHF57567.1 hypothetical protein SPE_0438 [Spiroplasma eriocheiris CCTCC M 207170]AKM54024.1 hypothetical protein SERIO_v1c04450 [Spiroplasma eriocheiris]